MNKFLSIVLVATIALLLSTTANAQQKKDSSYPLILNFYSIGTGTPGIKPLQKFITNYRKQNKLPAIRATQVSGLGREGEYAVVFLLKEMTTAQQKKFVAAVTKALPTLKQKSDRGGINMAQNEPFDTSRGRLKPETLIF